MSGGWFYRVVSIFFMFKATFMVWGALHNWISRWNCKNFVVGALMFIFSFLSNFYFSLYIFSYVSNVVVTSKVIVTIRIWISFSLFLLNLQILWILIMHKQEIGKFVQRYKQKVVHNQFLVTNLSNTVEQFKISTRNDAIIMKEVIEL